MRVNVSLDSPSRPLPRVGEENEGAVFRALQAITQQPNQSDNAMPYFVYYVTVNPDNNTKKLEYIDTKDNYREARALAREIRAGMDRSNPHRECRMIFAKTQVEAEKLLSVPREERVIGED